MGKKDPMERSSRRVEDVAVAIETSEMEWEHQFQYGDTRPKMDRYRAMALAALHAADENA